MNIIQKDEKCGCVIADLEDGSSTAYDGPTAIALIKSVPGEASPQGADAPDEDTARLRLLIVLAQYPECDQYIRAKYWQLINEGVDDITASRVIVAEMREMRPAIIAAREAPQRKKLADIAADMARMDEERARAQAETAWAQAETARIQAGIVQIEEGNTQLKDAVICGGTMAIFMALGGWVVGISGVLVGAVVGALPRPLYHLLVER
jgi:hypothetical protein